ncbi:hypothetical protein D3C72_2530640 [compost metagenome]
MRPSAVWLEKSTSSPGNEAASELYSAASGWLSSTRVTCGAPASVITPIRRLSSVDQM